MRMFRKKMKKAQVTAFIIMGIVILVATAIFFLAREKAYIFVPEEVHPELRGPVQNFIDQCLYDVGSEAVKQLALSGGYIYLPDSMRYDPLASIKFHPAVPVGIPLWQYRNELRIPSLEKMASDMKRYVEENIDSCLNGLEPFQDSYNVYYGKPNVSVTIGRSDVVFDMHFPVTLTAKFKDETNEYEDFSVRVDAKLLRAYELAKEFLERENERGFMEKITVEQLAIDPEIPLNGVKFQCARLTWYEPELKKRLQDALSIIIPGLRFRNTYHAPFNENEERYREWQDISVEQYAVGNLPDGSPPEDMWEYSKMFINFTDKDFSELSLSVMYLPQWGMLFNAKPSDGPFMKSAQQRATNRFLSMMCVQIIHFVYDIYYPVLVSINEPTSFGGEGLLFRFGMPVVVVDNQPNREVVPSSIDVPAGGSEEFCSSRTRKTFAFYAVDYYTGEQINHVNFTYRCFAYDCPLGETRPDGGEYRLVASVPDSCVNGDIIASKSGYITGTAVFTGEDQTTLRLYPSRKYEVAAKKLELPDYWAEEDLDSNDLVLIQLESNETGHSVYAKVPPEQGHDKIELILGDVTYEASIMFIDNGVFAGGYFGNWTTNYTEMKDASSVTFKVAFEEPPPEDQDSQLELMTFLYNNRTYLEDLKPEFR
ncbi:hypothetical protein D6764_05185 [Candidatus Woesearchaeota archaeon]|nr:MAG: hypothetical protein D6764_05185 [Candidatus Woesearchaeota archaeon]